MTKVTCPLSAAVAAHGDQTALIDNDRRLTYRELNVLVSQTVEHLRESGVKRGDRLAIIEQNRLEYVIALFALFRIGAAACLFSHHLGGRGLRDLAAQTKCTSQLVFSDSSVPSEKAVLPTIDIPCADKLTSSIDNSIASIDLDQPATIMTTSGSTGTPKAVLHSYGNHYYNAVGSNQNISVQPGDRWLVSLSLFHVGGLAILLRCLLGGGTAVIGQPSGNLLSDIKRHKISHISVVTTQLRRLLADLSEAGDTHVTERLKAVLLGGGPADESLPSAAKKAGLPLFTSYGLTEMASQVCTSPPGRLEIVKPLKFRQVRVTDRGEILVKGETLFRGYVEGDDTRLPLDAEGWFATGDMGKLDEHNGLTVTGRKDNMFISGGENVHPEEIERCLLRQDKIEDAVVVPVPDAEFDCRPAAFVLFASENAALSEDEMKAGLVEQGLPRFKIPVAFFPWPEDDAGNEMKHNRVFLESEAERLFLNR